jgi:hypothetical protein
LAIVYFVTFRDMVGCPQGHVYERVLGECPKCAQLAPPPVVVQPQQPVQAPPSTPVRAAPQAPTKPKAQAWLTAPDGRNYQLNLGTTTIGKHSRNDIQISGDPTVSRDHAKIQEQNGHFRIHDLASKNGTRVNGRLVRQPVLLEADDQVQFGDNTILRFVK